MNSDIIYNIARVSENQERYSSFILDQTVTFNHIKVQNAGEHFALDSYSCWRLS